MNDVKQVLFVFPGNPLHDCKWFILYRTGVSLSSCYGHLYSITTCRGWIFKRLGVIQPNSFPLQDNTSHVCVYLGCINYLFVCVSILLWFVCLNQRHVFYISQLKSSTRLGILFSQLFIVSLSFPATSHICFQLFCAPIVDIVWRMK